MAQHAELAPASEDHRAQAGRKPKKAHQHRDRLHRVGHGEAAIEDAQRQVADLAGVGHVEFVAAGQRAQRFHHRRRRRARREPERAVVHAPVAGEPRVVVAIDEDRAVLAGIVAEHAGDREWIAPAQQWEPDLRTGREAVDVLHRFADPNGTRRHGGRLLDERKCALGKVARDEHQRRALRIEDDTPATQELHPGYPGDRAHALDERGLEKPGVARVRGAEIELRRQHRHEPVVDRLAKRRHHDCHRRHQREARDDRRQAHRRLSRRGAQLCERQREARAARQRQHIEYRAREARHQRDAADQQTRDRRVAEKRQTVHCRHEGEHRAHDDEHYAGQCG